MSDLGKKQIRILFIAMAFVMSSACQLWAHDFDLLGEELAFGNAEIYWHTDGEDETGAYKGFFMLGVQNTGETAWTDFHFQIEYKNEGESGVYFIDNGITSSQNNMIYSLSSDGQTLNMYFYGDTVGNHDVAYFTVYTDNTENKYAEFGITVWPTSSNEPQATVPVPAAFYLLGSGITGLACIRKKRIP